MSELTCAEVEARDLEAAYLAGRMTPAEAEAFEAHYFGCDRCWAAVQLAQEVRGAFPWRPAASAAWKRPLAAAAVVAVVAALGWWTVAQRGRIPADSLRGAGDSLAIRVSPTATGVSVVWAARAGTDRYRVRAFGPDGVLLAERESADTTVELAIPAGAEFLDVTAFDPLRQPLATSGLVRLGPTPP